MSSLIINKVVGLIDSICFLCRGMLSSVILNYDSIINENTTINYKINYILLSIYFKGSFYFLLIITVLAVLIFSFSKSKNSQNLNPESTNLLKILCSISFLISMGLLFFCLYFYLIFLLKFNNNLFLNNIIKVSPFTFKSNYDFYINFDFFGTIILLIAYFVGFLSFLALDNKMFSKNIKYFFFLNLFIIIVFFFITSNNILNIFLLYEFLLIPSFLLVFFLSPGRKSTQASLYFII